MDELLRYIKKQINYLMPFLHSVVHTLTLVLTIVTVICAGILVIPRFFGYTPYVILSGSMEPQIPTGSLTYINTKDKTPEINDIVGYQLNEDVTVIHRVIAADPDTGSYITKGDANQSADTALVEQNQILGTWVLSVRNAGYILAVFETPVVEIGPTSIPGPILILIGFVILLNTTDSFLTDYINDKKKKGQKS